MEKRMFQVLDEMNLHDCEHNTSLVQVGAGLIGAQGRKKNDELTFGVPKGTMEKVMMTGEVMAFVVLIDKEQYLKYKAQ